MSVHSGTPCLRRLLCPFPVIQIACCALSCVTTGPHSGSRDTARKGSGPLRRRPGVWPILPAMPAVSLITLFALFTEPVVSKARAKRLEENVRSQRNCKHVYSLGAGTTAVAAADTLYSLLADPADTALPQPHQPNLAIAQP